MGYIPIGKQDSQYISIYLFKQLGPTFFFYMFHVVSAKELADELRVLNMVSVVVKQEGDSARFSLTIRKV